MAKVLKKVETYTVITLSKSEIPYKFEDIITADNVIDRAFSIKGKMVSYRILEKNKEYIVGLVETTRNSSLPPKKDRKKKQFAKLGLTEDESLAYANVFLYEYKRKVLMYETNGSGCMLDHFLIYLLLCSKDKKAKFKDFDIKLNPVLNADEYKRMLRMTLHKTLEFEIANPTEVVKAYQHKHDAFFSFLKSAANIQSGIVKAKYDIRFDKGTKHNTTGLASKAMKEMVDNLLTLSRTPAGQNIEKLMVVGYEEQDSNKLSTIDLIADRYIQHIELNEPLQHSDLLEEQRKSQIKILYDRCSSDFDTLFGK